MQVTGQKAQTLTSLHRRAGQDDAVDLLLTKCRDCGGDCKVRLTRTGGANADGDGVFQHTVHIPLLSDGLGLDGTALGGDADDIAGQLADLVRLSASGKADHIAHGLLADGFSTGGEGQQRVDGLGRHHGLLRLTVDAQLALTVGHDHMKFRLDQSDVLIK